MSMYLDKLVWPVDLRPHYDVKPDLVEALGHVDVDAASLAVSLSRAIACAIGQSLLVPLAVPLPVPLPVPFPRHCPSCCPSVARPSPVPMHVRCPLIARSIARSTTPHSPSPYRRTYEREPAPLPPSPPRQISHHAMVVPPGAPLLAIARAISAACFVAWAWAHARPWSRGLVAVAVQWVAAWVPCCGVVQHGMVQLGGDRYSCV